MALKVTNNASTTIAGSINASVTAINLAGGTGSLFPTLSGGDWFWGTLIDASNNIEVVKVTARSTDALTVTRGQDGTTAKSYTVGDRFELRPTAALFNDKADKDNPTFTTGITSPVITLGASSLQTLLDAKAPLASPTLTGTPAAPTATVGTNTTQLATTAFVTGALTTSVPVFSAYASVDQSITSATWTRVTLGTEDFDTGSNFATSTFTATIAGHYHFSGSVRVNSATLTQAVAAIYKNNAAYRAGDLVPLPSAVNSDMQVSVSCDVYLGVGDYVDLRGQATGGTPKFSYSGSSSTTTSYLSGHLVRPA